jgi:hypothetical protein
LRSPQKAQLCNPCLRNEMSPLSQEGHKAARILSGKPLLDVLEFLSPVRQHWASRGSLALKL